MGNKVSKDGIGSPEGPDHQHDEDKDEDALDGPLLVPPGLVDGQEFVRHYIEKDRDPVTCVMFFDDSTNVVYYNTSQVHGQEVEEEGAL
jgi:hypothetical protein